MIDSNKLDEQIAKLDELVEKTTTWPLIWDITKEQWDEIFELMSFIQQNFTQVRYPKKFEREQAWVKFNQLRNKAFESKRKHYEDRSQAHCNELWRRLRRADYNWFVDLIEKNILWGEFKVSIDEMKENGKILNEAGSYFKEKKYEMTKEHKAEIHEKFIDVRKSHDLFWGRVREYREEQNKLYEEKKQVWEDKKLKSKEIKERLINNREKLRNTLSNTEDYLYKVEDQIRVLKEKIDNAYSDNYREKHEEFLSERQDKLGEVENQIEKIKGWIQEINEKLDIWD